MYDIKKKKLKAFMWMKFVFIDLETGRVKTHPEDLMDVFTNAFLPVKDESFEARRLTLKG